MVLLPKKNKLVCVCDDTHDPFSHPDCKLIVWDLIEFTSISFEIIECIDQINMLSDERVVTLHDNGCIRFWDFKTSTIPDISIRSSSGQTKFIVLSNDNLVTCAVTNIEIWKDTHNIMTLTGHTHSVLCFTELPNQRLVSGSEDHTIRIWNLSSGVCERVILEHARNIEILPASGKFVCININKLSIWDPFADECEKFCLDFVNDEHILVINDTIISGCGNDLKMWDTKSNITRKIQGHTLKNIIRLPNNEFATSSPANNTIKLWDSASRCLSTWKVEHTEPIVVWDNKFIMNN